MLTRHHYPSVSLTAQPTPILETRPFGFEGVDLDWRSGNVLPRLPSLRMARPESSHYQSLGGKENESLLEKRLDACMQLSNIKF